jgi:hypothetical protein
VDHVWDLYTYAGVGEGHVHHVWDLNTYAGVGEGHVAPAAVDHVPLGHALDLGVILRKPDKPVALGLAALDVSFDLTDKIK